MRFRRAFLILNVKKILHNASQICVHLYFNFVSLALNMHLNVAFFVKRLFSYLLQKPKSYKKNKNCCQID